VELKWHRLILGYDLIPSPSIAFTFKVKKRSLKILPTRHYTNQQLLSCHVNLPKKIMMNTCKSSINGDPRGSRGPQSGKLKFLLFH
jgi:hypothetical protein